MAATTLFVVFVALLIVGMPVAFGLAIASLSAIFLVEVVPFSYVSRTLFTSLDSYPLLAVPLFVFAGSIMEFGGLSRRLINVARAFLGHVTGGLGVVGLGGTAIFAMLSGSGPATVAAIGGIMIPAMIRDGYPRGYSAALMACAGGCGIVLPPSIPLIIYGITTNTSIGDLFIAGLAPGFLIVTVLFFANRISCKNNKKIMKAEAATWRERFAAINDAKWTLLMPFIVLGGIYGGVFTPTEAAGVAVAYSLVLAICYKEMEISQIPGVLHATMLMSGMILIIIATASTYSRVLTLERIPNQIIEFLTTLPLPFWSILAIILIFLLFVGMFMETIAGIILLAPILVPVVGTFGMDPVHFGIVLIMASMIGFSTPPVGDNLNVASALANISIEKVSVSALPMVAALITVLFIVAFMPEVSLFLVNILR